MSKKTKSAARKAAAAAAQSSTRPSILSTGVSSRTIEREFNPDYSNVIKDLRRILTLAGSLFAILIVLSFFLR